MDHKLSHARSYKWEKHDCVVIAFTHVTGLTYPVIHEMFKSLGRRDKKGFASMVEHKWYRNSPFKFRRSTLKPRLLKTWIQEHKKGRYILETSNHMFCCLDGVIMNPTKLSPYIRIRASWEYVGIKKEWCVKLL